MDHILQDEAHRRKNSAEKTDDPIVSFVETRVAGSTTTLENGEK